MDTSRTFPSVQHIQYLNVQYSNFKSAHTHVCPKFRCIDGHSGQRRGLAWPPAKTNNRRVYERVSSCLSKEIRLQRRGHSPQFSRIEALLPPAVSILASGIFRLVFPYSAFGKFPQDQAALPEKKERDEILVVAFRSRSKNPTFFSSPLQPKNRDMKTQERKNPPPPLSFPWEPITLGLGRRGRRGGGKTNRANCTTHPFSSQTAALKRWCWGGGGGESWWVCVCSAGCWKKNRIFAIISPKNNDFFVKTFNYDFC